MSTTSTLLSTTTTPARATSTIPYSHHGTNVAGLIAARDNDQGVRGVAPRATIYGHNLLDAPLPTGSDEISDFDIAHAAGNNSGVTAVSNNSWGSVDGPEADGAPALWELAIENGVTRGYDGRGVFYVWAAGNGHLRGDDSNLDGFANFYAVTAACAVNEAGARSYYSEMGANLWVCAPSNHPRTEEGYRSIVTTENSDRYIDDFGGTSAATPIVSGVAALVREANPDLTWRDLKLILAETARKNDPTNPGWQDGARMYGLASDADRYHFNHEYGFGVVDAAAAVDLARSWTNLPPLQEAGIHSAKIDRLIPDAYDAASIETVTLTLTLNLDTGIDFTEFVEINTVFQHNSFRDLDIELESPSGVVSKLAVPFDTFTDDDDPEDDYIPMRGPYRFGSAKHLGEDPNGVWTLRITDIFRLGIGSIESWGITVYGHTPDNILPTFPDGETTTRSVAENTPAGDPVGHPVAATDNEALNYTLGGPDTALFAIDAATGQLTVGPGTSLDFEDPANTDHEYTVTVTADRPVRRNRHDHRHHHRDRRVPRHTRRHLRRRPQREDLPRRGHPGHHRLPGRPHHQGTGPGDYQPLHLRLTRITPAPPPDRPPLPQGEGWGEGEYLPPTAPLTPLHSLLSAKRPHSLLSAKRPRP